MEHLRLRSEPHLHSPVLIYAFTGWNDAGDAASGALEHMIANWAATEVGDIDPEWFTDFATVRPSVRLERDGSGRGTPRRHIEWPVVRVWSASLPGADALLLLGPEPALRWRTFADQVVGLAERCGVSMAISLGALLADFPHSQPTQIIGTASDDELLDRFELRPSTYEGPTGIVGVLGDALTVAGMPTASLWATVPGYAAQIPSPKACEALVRAACAMVGTTAPAGAFTEPSPSTRRASPPSWPRTRTSPTTSPASRHSWPTTRMMMMMMTTTTSPPRLSGRRWATTSTLTSSTPRSSASSATPAPAIRPAPSDRGRPVAIALDA